MTKENSHDGVVEQDREGKEVSIYSLHMEIKGKHMALIVEILERGRCLAILYTWR
eukprot:c35967_g1_i1 orf=60-224(+)